LRHASSTALWLTPFLLLAGAAGASPDFPTRNAFQPAVALNLPPDCPAATASPSWIVPANGEFVPVSVSGVTDPDGDPVDLMFTAIRQDEPIGGGDPDAAGVGTATAKVRASRSGQGDGRVYHLNFRATDPEGLTCAGEVTVCVPLNSGSPACGDGGAIVDSTTPRPRNASLLWSTFLGGSGDEVKLADVEIDASNHAWIAGTTASEDYPVLKGEPPNGYDDEYFFLDAFVSRVTPNGALERSGYSGEYYSDDFVEDLAIGPDGTTWLAGWYDSYEDVEVIVSRTAKGRSVGGSFQFFNGEEVDLAFAVATDREGNAYIAGSSGSHWFAGTGAYIENRVGNYVLKLGPDGQLQKLFLLPEPRGQARAVAVDAAGNLYVAGGSGPDVWVLKLDPAGNLLWQADIGGSQDEEATSIAVDTAGQAWVAGWTESPDFPVHGGRLHAGGRDAFLVRLTSGGAIDVSTLLGGSGMDEAQDLALDGLGRPYLAGLTSSADFPLSGPLAGSCGAGRECGAGSDAFAASFDLYATSNLVLTFATRLGGGSLDEAHGVAVTPAGTYLWVSGLTRSMNFQTLKPWQPALAGEGDAFLARIILSGR
jgi:DNA-binding beta-propeller fold protein YncE